MGVRFSGSLELLISVTTCLIPSQETLRSVCVVYVRMYVSIDVCMGVLLDTQYTITNI